MESADGRYVIVYNGEIYNFKEIKKELTGYPFKSESDTEVILAAYAKWGAECLQKFNGMFAFAILDRQNGELFIARDRIGIKPLYYYQSGEKFIFSSEVKAIFAHKVEQEIDVDMMNVYFRLLYVPAPKTIWKSIYKLEPGHYLKIKNSRYEN